MRSARGSTERTHSSDTVQGDKHVPSITPVGTIDKQWLLYGEVFRAPDQSGARRLFALGKAAGTGCFSDFFFKTQNLVFPRFGDEEIAAAVRRAFLLHHE